MRDFARRAASVVRALRRRAVALFVRDIWQRDLDAAPPLERVLFTVLRLAAVVKRGFGRHELSMRAGALTYVTVLSLVPTLAVAFAMFKAFGGLGNAESVLLPKLVQYLAVGVRDEAQSRIHDLLVNIHTGAIGATGVVFLMFAAVSLLSSIEEALNDIWGVQSRRGWFQRVTTYWTVVTVTPTLLLIAISIPGVFRSIAPLTWVLERTGTVDFFFSIVLPVVFVCGTFTLTYTIMTDAPVPPGAALAGGVTAGVLWSLAASAYAWYARSTVYYANVYGSLSAIPIFIFWIYLSWFIVLLGALLAFAWQNLGTYRQEMLSPDASQASRELLALRIMIEIARRFIGASPPARADELAPALHVSGRLANEVVDRLVAIDWLLAVGDERTLVPRRDPAELTPTALIAALRGDGESRIWRHRDATTHALERRQREERDAVEQVWQGATFADLARDDSAVDPGGRRSADAAASGSRRVAAERAHR